MKKKIAIALYVLFALVGFSCVGASFVKAQEIPTPTPAPTEQPVHIPDQIHPTFLPGGKSIGYVSNETGYFQIYVMGIDFTSPRWLANFPSDMLNPTWSPDGNEILFWSKQKGLAVIFKMPADGSSVQALLVGSHPVWSPDGTMIAYINSTGKNMDVFVANADGTHIRQITQNDYDDANPTWSPDGKMIAYTRQISANNFMTEIFETPVDGSSSEIQLTNLEMFIFQIKFSADGKYFAFAGGTPNHSMNIFILSSDGKSLQQVTDDYNDNRDPQWAPDGRHLVYSAHFPNTGHYQIVLVSW